MNTAFSQVATPTGSSRRCKGWHQEAALRCLMNNLDPAVAEAPDQLVVYGDIGKAARNWDCFAAIVRELEMLEDDETLLIQSGKPVAVFATHEGAARVLIANSNLVGAWASWDEFHKLDRQGLMMYGQMTAGSWIFIGTSLVLFLNISVHSFVKAPGHFAGLRFPEIRRTSIAPINLLLNFFRII